MFKSMHFSTNSMLVKLISVFCLILLFSFSSLALADDDGDGTVYSVNSLPFGSGIIYYNGPSLPPTSCVSGENYNSQLSIPVQGTDSQAVFDTVQNLLISSYTPSAGDCYVVVTPPDPCELVAEDGQFSGSLTCPLNYTLKFYTDHPDAQESVDIQVQWTCPPSQSYSSDAGGCVPF